jgi:hypothetical protein
VSLNDSTLFGIKYFDRQEFWDWQDEPLEKEGKNEASAKSKLITMT